MGNKKSTTVKNDCIEGFSNINEDELDISNIDRLQIIAIKEMNKRLDKLEKEKQTELFYAMPKIDLCNYRLF